jgi:hypothetical protein
LRPRNIKIRWSAPLRCPSSRHYCRTSIARKETLWSLREAIAAVRAESAA